MNRNAESVSIRDIMTTRVVTVLPNTPVLEVARMLGEHKFDGLPVVDVDNRLVGIINEYDLLSKGSAIHLPTLNMVLKNLSRIDKDNDRYGDGFRKIFDLKAEDVMNDDPLTLDETATFEDAVVLFTEHHRVNPVPVIDRDRRILGIVSRYDILKVFRILSAN